MILGIKTDSYEAELYLLDDGEVVVEKAWDAGRKLSIELLGEIDNILEKAGIDKSDLGGIVIFAGPGSFTGLRIGVSVANAMAYSLDISIVATKDDDWLDKGIDELKAAKKGVFVKPFYGRGPNITTPKK